jgi:phenylpyruvate tautomerase PptA (4-oxalocrotonate tautomerase family)
MPYLRLTCPELPPEQRTHIAERLTDEVNTLFFNPHGGPSQAELRERTTVHFALYHDGELYIGGRTPVQRGAGDLTLELSDWNLSVAAQRRIAARLTPVLSELFGFGPADLDGVNIRFHSYAPSSFAVGGRLLSDVVPRVAQLFKRLAK